MEISTLELTFHNGQTITVEPTGYQLKLKQDFFTDKHGMHKFGTFKINSSAYKAWEPIKKILYKRGEQTIGECTVLDEVQPIRTPRTITFGVRVDWPN